MRTTRRGRVIAALCGVLAGLVVLEAFMAMVWPQENIYLYEYRDGYVFGRPNYDGVFSLSPLASVKAMHRSTFFRHFGHEYSWLPSADETKLVRHTNARGELDERTPDFESKPGQTRILNLGACMATGWAAEEDHTYLRRLEQLLPAVETINCAMFLTNLPEAVERYEKLCSRFEVDVVLLAMNADVNDDKVPKRDWLGADHRLLMVLAELFGVRAANLIELADDGTLALDHEALTSDMVSSLRAFYQPKLPFYDSNAVIRLVENRWLAVHQFPVGGRSVVGQYHRRLRRRAGLARPTLEDTLSLNLSYYQRLRTQVEARQAKLVVVFLPMAIRVTPQASPEAPDFVSTLAAALRDRGFTVLEIGAAPGVDPLSKYRRMNGYPIAPNDDGHQYFAEEIADTLRAVFSAADSSPAAPGVPASP